jgi:uncharacterized membrane protein
MGGLNWAEHTVEINAPIETCFEAIVDYESFSEWQRAVVATEVLDRHKDGLGRRVRLFVDAKVRKVDYTLDYRYRRPALIEWDFVEGNGINDADGSYTFEQLGAGRTRATYKFGLEVGLPLPGVVARRAHKQTLKASVEDLKKEAERRARAAAPEAAETGARPRAGAEAGSGTDEDEALESRRFGIPHRRRTDRPTVERSVEAAAARRATDPGAPDDDSITDAAVEVASASLRLARAVASRSIGVIRRLRP